MSAGTRTLTAPNGVSYRFDSGCFALELLLTGGPGMFERYEILHAPADLAAWLVDSRLVLEAPLSVDTIQISADELALVKTFRNTLLEVAQAVAYGKNPRPAHLSLINDCAGETLRPTVDPRTRRLRWATPVTGAQVLGYAAREAIELLATDRAERIHQCSGDRCHLLYLDTSRSGNRRWCSMQRCGNRQKVRDWRARRSSP